MSILYIYDLDFENVNPVVLALSARHHCNVLRNCLFYSELVCNVDICDGMLGFLIISNSVHGDSVRRGADKQLLTIKNVNIKLKRRFILLHCTDVTVLLLSVVCERGLAIVSRRPIKIDATKRGVL